MGGQPENPKERKPEMNNYNERDDYFAIEAMLADMAARESAPTAEEIALADAFVKGVL